MKTVDGVSLENVQGVYSGPEGLLWKLIMGEQIHIGGLASSMDLAQRADIRPGTLGVDLCCCTGAGMRFLTRFRGVKHMTGVDATPHVLAEGRRISGAEGLAAKITFLQADVIRSGVGSGAADFVWGEDAWCYVEDKLRLIQEAARIVRQGGTIAFTDWVEGPGGLTDREAERFLRFMKFPSFASIEDYSSLLGQHGCQVLTAEDTGRFPAAMDLYLNMLNFQLTYDALKIIGFDQKVMEGLAAEMIFARDLAHARKIVQGIFIAIKV